MMACQYQFVTCHFISERSANDNGIRFPTVRSEDIFFNTRVARVAQRVYTLRPALYNYRHDNQASITQSFHDGTIKSFVSFYESLGLLAAEEPEEYRDEVILRMRRRIIDYTRAMGFMILKVEPTRTKRLTYLSQAVSEPIVRWAVKGFPSRCLPFQQRLFYFALLWRSKRAMLLLLDLRLRLEELGCRSKVSHSAFARILEKVAPRGVTPIAIGIC